MKNKVKRLHIHSSYINESCKILFRLQQHKKEWSPVTSSYFHKFIITKIELMDGITLPPLHLIAMGNVGL